MSKKVSPHPGLSDRPIDDSIPLVEAIFQALPDLLFYLDRDGKIVHYLAGNTSALYKTPQEFLGKKMVDVLPEHVGSLFATAIRATQKTGKPSSFRYDLPTPAGFQSFEAKIIDHSDMQVVVVRDITEIKTAASGTRRELDVMTTLYENARDQIQALRTIDQAILSNLDLKSTAPLILKETARQTRSDALNLLVVDPQTRTLKSVGKYGFQFDTQDRPNIRLETGPGSHSIFEKQHIYSRKFEEAANIRVTTPSAQEGFKTYLRVPLIARNEIRGILEIFQRADLELIPERTNLLETIASQIAIAIDNSLLLDILHRSYTQLGTVHEATIKGLITALELRDSETEGHTRRVTEMTLWLARYMGVSEVELTYIRQGAMLHDIGKMGIPDSILLKPNPLTPAEWEIMRQHPTYAFDILNKIEYLKPALDIPLHHHEKWDGSGYPYGLKGVEIPLAARIFAITDVYDALTSDRPYRTAWSRERVLAYIRSESDKHFDPDITKIFLRLMGNNVASLVGQPAGIQKPNLMYFR